MLLIELAKLESVGASAATRADPAIIRSESEQRMLNEKFAKHKGLLVFQVIS